MVLRSRYRLDKAGIAGAFTALLESADVFVTNMRTSALERLGIHPKALHERYPRMIIVSVRSISGTPHIPEWP